MLLPARSYGSSIERHVGLGHYHTCLLCIFALHCSLQVAQHLTSQFASTPAVCTGFCRACTLVQIRYHLPFWLQAPAAHQRLNDSQSGVRQGKGGSVSSPSTPLNIRSSMEARRRRLGLSALQVCFFSTGNVKNIASTVFENVNGLCRVTAYCKLVDKECCHNDCEHLPA